MVVLLTGGAGYIGSHTCLELLKQGYDVISVDNYCNASPEALTARARAFRKGREGIPPGPAR